MIIHTYYISDNGYSGNLSSVKIESFFVAEVQILKSSPSNVMVIVTSVLVVSVLILALVVLKYTRSKNTKVGDESVLEELNIIPQVPLAKVYPDPVDHQYGMHSEE